MSAVIEVPLPDIGDFDQVDVIEVLVSQGDRVRKEDSLITLESEKATMEVPSPRAGTVRDIRVSVGDKVTQGDVILRLEVDEGPAAPTSGPFHDEQAEQAELSKEQHTEEPAAAAESDTLGREVGEGETVRAEVVVLGSGPGGYTAAFRAADLGKNVVLVERYPTLGGVCLNVGCIPSKALLHVGEVIDQAAALGSHGVEFGEPRVDLQKLRKWKDGVVSRLTSGLDGLAGKRGIQVIQGAGRFVSSKALDVDSGNGKVRVEFEYAIVAAGSRSVELPGLPTDDGRVLNSTSALELNQTQGNLLVVGGGIIGLEMATIYQSLGSRVTVAELSATLMPGADADLVRVLKKRIDKRYENIFLQTRVTGVDAGDDGLTVHFDGPKAPESQRFDQILVAVGRYPNADRIGAQAAGVETDESGFIRVDAQMRTSVSNIFAIGDIVGQPMLAHKASHEAKVAAEVVAGLKRAFEPHAIPSVAYTDPEVAWAGVTEAAARAQNIDYGKGTFPWGASGRALSMERGEGLTKILFDKSDNRVIGVGIVGPRAGELIAEGVLAIEMGADAADLALSIHPHPTLSETVGLAAENFEGTITDLYVPKR